MYPFKRTVLKQKKNRQTKKNDPTMDNGGVLLIIVKIQIYVKEYGEKYGKKKKEKINTTKDQ